MKRKKRQPKKTYTEFIESGKEVFPKDMYYIRKMTFGKIKHKLILNQ